MLGESLGKEANFKAMKKKLIAILIRFQILFSLLFIPLLFRESEDVCRWISSDFQLEAQHYLLHQHRQQRKPDNDAVFFLSLLFNPSCSGFSTLVICIIFTEQNAPEDDEKLKEEGNQSKKESSVIERERKPETQYHGMAGETSRGIFFLEEKEK